jgi:hypothetical protein
VEDLNPNTCERTRPRHAPSSPPVRIAAFNVYRTYGVGTPVPPLDNATFADMQEVCSRPGALGAAASSAYWMHVPLGAAPLHPCHWRCKQEREVALPLSPPPPRVLGPSIPPNPLHPILS